MTDNTNTLSPSVHIRMGDKYFMRRWRCNDCNEIHLELDLLAAPNPFDASDTLTGCPYCKSVNDFIEMCDEPDCHQEAGCGFPIEGGYRRTCYGHSVFKKGAP